MKVVEQLADSGTVPATNPVVTGAGLRRQLRRPLLWGAMAVLAIAAVAAWIAAHVSVFALDETLIEQSAVHYTHDFPHSLFHDLDARATNRLYSLVLSLAFRLFAGYTAVVTDHVLTTFLFVSAVIPIYLVALVILRSRQLAMAAAVLSIAVPWLTLTSAFFTENLSYPLFWWMMLATCSAVWRPSFWRDVLALLSIVLLVCTRVQFLAIFPGYVVALLAVAFIRQGEVRGTARRVGHSLLQSVTKSPLTFAVLVAAIAGFVYERTSSHWQVEVERLLGTYSNVVIRNGVSTNMVEGMLIELIALALGVGLLPAIVSLTWYVKRMARPRLDRAWIFLCASGTVLIFFLVLTTFSQGGYLGSGTEERYFFYVMPVFWVGTLAALQGGELRSGELLACGAAFAALYGSIPLVSALTQETAFLAPAESIVPHVLEQRISQLGINGLSMQDALAIIALVAGAVAAYLWRLRPTVRLGWIVGISAAMQLLVTGYAFAVVTGHVSGIAGRTGGDTAALGWVDRHARSAEVSWLDNLSLSAPPTSETAPGESQQRTTLFWNSTITTWITVPTAGTPSVESPMSALPGLYFSLDRHSGLLTPKAVAATIKEVVGATASPFVQLEGKALARSPDGVLTLTKLNQPVRAGWLAEGLLPEGGVPTAAHVKLSAYGDALPIGRRPSVLTAALTFEPVARSGGAAKSVTVLGVSLGGAHAKIVLRAGGRAVVVHLVTCTVSPTRLVTGALVVKRSSAGAVAGYLKSVTVLHGGACGGRLSSRREH